VTFDPKHPYGRGKPHDAQRGHVAPKKGLPRLRELIEQRQAQNKEPGAWQPAQTQQHAFKVPSARIATPDNRTDLQRRADERHDAREQLSNDLALDLLSVRIQARDRKHRGKIVECWVRGQLLRRIVEKPSPNRDGMSHDKYSVAIALLVSRGIAEALPSGANGYRWTHDYERIGRRADWLVGFVRREGEMRKMNGPQRYQVFDG
jgi:hypothetical protein